MQNCCTPRHRPFFPLPHLLLGMLVFPLAVGRTHDFSAVQAADRAPARTTGGHFPCPCSERWMCDIIQLPARAEVWGFGGSHDGAFWKQYDWTQVMPQPRGASRKGATVSGGPRTLAGQGFADSIGRRGQVTAVGFLNVETLDPNGLMCHAHAHVRPLPKKKPNGAFLWGLMQSGGTVHAGRTGVLEGRNASGGGMGARRTHQLHHTVSDTNSTNGSQLLLRTDNCPQRRKLDPGLTLGEISN
jgi:hypothetical protein